MSITNYADFTLGELTLLKKVSVPAQEVAILDVVDLSAPVIFLAGTVAARAVQSSAAGVVGQFFGSSSEPNHLVNSCSQFTAASFKRPPLEDLMVVVELSNYFSGIRVSAQPETPEQGTSGAGFYWG